MKMPRGIFITYVCDGVGSSAVLMKTAVAVFMLFVCVTEKLRYVFILSAGDDQRLNRRFL
jgi:hypothetical protein